MSVLKIQAEVKDSAAAVEVAEAHQEVIDSETDLVEEMAVTWEAAEETSGIETTSMTTEVIDTMIEAEATIEEGESIEVSKFNF